MTTQDEQKYMHKGKQGYCHTTAKINRPAGYESPSWIWLLGSLLCDKYREAKEWNWNIQKH